LNAESEERNVTSGNTNSDFDEFLSGIALSTDEENWGDQEIVPKITIALRANVILYKNNDKWGFARRKSSGALYRIGNIFRHKLRRFQQT